ncbi:MAG TPA: hypothetical protein VFN35_07100 [Ktedonobacteraceae bacterium]|nr:hypothetical protein [Ktedonobacteraceae bacterium]
MPGTEEKYKALLEDLQQLSTYLHGRGEKTLAMSKKFAENAKRDPSNQEFDLNQARMLDYQHQVWHEIGNMVEKLLKQYEKA